MNVLRNSRYTNLVASKEQQNRTEDKKKQKEDYLKKSQFLKTCNHESNLNQDV